MRKKQEKKNKKMKKGKTLMILTIVMLVLLAGSMIRISKADTNEDNEEINVGLVSEGSISTESDSEFIEDSAGNQFQTKIKPPEAPAEIPAVEDTKKPVLEFPSQEARDNFNQELKIIEVFNNQIRVEDNKVIYTAVNKDEEDIDLAKTYNAIILFDEKGNIESKTYTKKYSEKVTRKTIVKPKEGTEKSWINDLLISIIIDTNNDGEFDDNDKKIDISQEMGIKDISYEGGVYSATLSLLMILKKEVMLSTPCNH